MDDLDSETQDLREQIFHNHVREQVVSLFVKWTFIKVFLTNGPLILQIFLLLFTLLYLSSFAFLRRFKRKGHDDYYSTDEDEVMVYRISTWLCTFSLSISIGSVLLLPISIISNEVLILYPKSYYVKWLNSSLIQGEHF